MDDPYRNNKSLEIVVNTNEVSVCDWCKFKKEGKLSHNKYDKSQLNSLYDVCYKPANRHETFSLMKGRKVTWARTQDVRGIEDICKQGYEPSLMTKILRIFGFRKPAHPEIEK